LVLALINIISRSTSIMQLLNLLFALISLSHIAIGYVLDLDKAYMDLHLYNHNCLEMWNGSPLQMEKKFDLKAPM
jgi:hypothetical protein